MSQEEKKAEKTYTQEHIERAKKNGIDYHSFYRRIFQHGWDAERACTEPIQFTYPKEIHDLRKKHGITSALMRQRVAKGWDVHTAATHPKGKTRPELMVK